VGRIETYCFGLTDFPERGTMRDDLWPGLRTVGFERRATIAFTAWSMPVWLDGTSSSS
jgi:toxin ParE1/3/4